MLTRAAFPILPFKNTTNPKATQMTSVQTIAVELATEVCFKDSNHAEK